MIRIAGQTETYETLKWRLIDVHKYLEAQGDFENAKKIKQLANKLIKKEFTIAFCGHFSAGKSTMINQILGANILPSSPIPTSANLVKIKSGEDYAKVYFKYEKPRIYLAPYDYNLVKNYCKDGDQIDAIEISDSKTHLPDSTAIMDTPGIDSADDAHRIATESAIHLADLVFYVMDYNHVQAELNFLFTKELMGGGKEVYLVINQIDKHREEELSFAAFKQSTVASFAAWGVKPERIFYTSLKKKDHPFNEFHDFQQFIAEKIAKKDESLLQAIYHSMSKITNDYLSQKGNILEENLEASREIISSLTQEEKKAISENFSRTQSELEKVKLVVEEAAKAFDQEINKIMKNAYLMPFETRALAEAYLTARQPEFKAGFLFAKQKTEAERKARLERFHQDILAKTKSQLEWHIREYLVQFLKKASLDSNELLTVVQSFSVSFSADLLESTVKPGAGLTGTYVLQYCDDVAAEIKAAVKKQLAPVKIDFFKVLKERNAKEIKKYSQKFKETEKNFLAYQEIKEKEFQLQAERVHIEELLRKTVPMEAADCISLFEVEEEEFEVVSDGGKAEADQKSKTRSIDRQEEKLQPAFSSDERSANRLQQVSEELYRTSNLIQKLAGFQKTAQILAEKASRLEHKGFTVALFGAFSAGKSSFANALMGEKVLPVSPNPTTAAINKIMPVTDENPHGTVLVKFKDAAGMLEDVNHSLKIFGVNAVAFSDALQTIEHNIALENKKDGVYKTHFSFLQAFKKGCGKYEKMLGTVYKTTSREFEEFVANEEKSCFVESIELYFDCELTRKGITLVDTPGADSINARHTGVSFDYIKNADAILFVTYYNHAFSKADREFLIQLGRVKDSFQLDKMFFIINAIDLAESEEEKKMVEDYVFDQLNTYGIRNAHLFSLSSMLALKNKISSTADTNSGMPKFQTAFYSFVENDLTNMAVNASKAELIRVLELLEGLVQSSKEDEAGKQQKRLKIESEKQQIHSFLSAQSAEPLQNRLEQEAEELLYYIKQRVFYRFGDFFKEAFNPSILKEDGRNLKKTLQAALDELLESIGFDFAQEMRAATVRLDRFAENVVKDFQAMIVRRLTEINAGLSFAAFELKNEDQLLFESAFQQLDKQIFAKALAYFKNPKSFFEKNEKKRMSEEIYEHLNQPADEYLQFQLERLRDYYHGVLARESSRLTAAMAEQVEDYYLSLISSLDGGVQVDKLMDIQQSLLKFKN
ncbi:dynamin family protein [Bacillota bacterium Lsc_1132]